MGKLAVSTDDAELATRIAEIVDSLERERRTLGRHAAPLELEANRLAITYWREELARLNSAQLSAPTRPKG